MWPGPVREIWLSFRPARLEIDSWAPEQVYQFWLRVTRHHIRLPFNSVNDIKEIKNLSLRERKPKSHCLKCSLNMECTAFMRLIWGTSPILSSFLVCEKEEMKVQNLNMDKKIRVSILIRCIQNHLQLCCVWFIKEGRHKTADICRETILAVVFKRTPKNAWVFFFLDN
jgi:hypothetical protein